MRKKDNKLSTKLALKKKGKGGNRARKIDRNRFTKSNNNKVQIFAHARASKTRKEA